MRKKDLLAGVYNVYASFDKISKHYIELSFASTDEAFVKLCLPSILVKCPLRDLQVFKIGVFNDVTGELKHSVRKSVKLDCYYFPHSRLSPPGENLSLEEIDETVQKTKNEIIANSASVEAENKNEGENNE